MSDADSFAPLLQKLKDGATLDAAQSAQAFGAIMSGTVAHDDIADFLVTQAQRKPTIDEIVGGARAMRATMRTIAAPANAIDLCGTGGDGHNTLNISTAAGFVVAACGAPVAKHGNRSASSRSGTADVLEVLGVRIDLEPKAAEACLAETNFCFLFAPHYHTAMKHVAPVRRQLGIRTIFNLLGPLSNPAQVKRQLLGVFAAEWTEPLAHVLQELGSEKAWLVHGADGMDELTTTASTYTAVLDGGRVSRREIVPEDIGLRRTVMSALKGGEAQQNAAALIGLLDGDQGPYRDIVLLNSAAALVVAGKVNDLKAGALMAADAIDSGAGRRVLARVAAISQKDIA
jgi:anthranilate phosphoribosyltransferase